MFEGNLIRLRAYKTEDIEISLKLIILFSIGNFLTLYPSKTVEQTKG